MRKHSDDQPDNNQDMRLLAGFVRKSEKAGRAPEAYFSQMGIPARYQLRQYYSLY